MVEKKATNNSKSKKRKEGKGTSKKPASPVKKEQLQLRDNIVGVCLVAVGIFLFVAMEFESAGQLGAIMGSFLEGLFGVTAYLLPWYLVVLGFLLFVNKAASVNKWSVSMSLLIFLMLGLFNAGRYIEPANIYYDLSKFYFQSMRLNSGGAIPMPIAMLLVKYIGKVGLYSLSMVIIVIATLLSFNRPVADAIDHFNEKKDKRKAKQEAKERIRLEAREEAERTLKAKKLEQEAKKTEKFQRWEESFKEKEVARYQSKLEEQEKPKGTNLFSLAKDKDLFTKKTSKNTLELPAVPTDSVGLEPTRKPSAGHGLDGESIKKKEAKESGFFARAKEQLKISSYQEDEPKDVVETKDVTEPLQSAKFEEELLKKSEAAKTLSMEPSTLTKAQARELTLNKEDFNSQKVASVYKKPPIDLLRKPLNKNAGNMNSILLEKAQMLEETLRNFNVDAKVVEVTQGPTVTRYEIQPNVGVKVSSIVRLSDDIALNLRAKSIRMEAPIPGKAAVGIEVENDNINMVTLRELVESREFKEAKSKISFAVGKDIAGKAIVGDLKSMPHLLIAGSTGSGKSVCINSIITSILYKASPDEVKLVLIDPKVVELGNYNGIPHLLVPVVTDPNKAAATLNWAVSEMTRRYKAFAEARVKDLSGYNLWAEKEESAEKMPQVVIIIDELADLMMAAPSQVEESICRLAQMARAAGMHLIVATQRPSVDVITGVIKANIPSRIAFAVSSQVDSRTILDMVGAEKLVGKGDMLFNPLGQGKPIRVQGCFVSEEEVAGVLDFIRDQGEDPQYSNDVMDKIERGNVSTASPDEMDELLPDAIKCVVESNQASVSMLQRRFRIGYNRAARIMDMMEERGIVGPQDGSKPRTILMSKEELEEIDNQEEREI